MEERKQLIELIMENFVTYADRTAISCYIGKPSISYAQLDEISGKVYSYLSARGIGPEDFVMINLPRSATVFAACIGVWRAGAAFTICEEDYPKEKVDYIYKDCGCKLKITTDLFMEMMGEEPKEGYVKCDEHTAAYAGYTSGTTGNPKGVIHEIGTLINCRKSHAYDGKEIFTCEDVLGLISPLNFAAAVMQMNPVLSAGAEIAVVPYEYVKDPVKLKLYFEAKNVTVGFLTPSLLHIFNELPGSIRVLFLSSEPACNIYFDNVDIYNMFAQTETGCVCAAFKLDKAYPVTPVGRSQIKEIELKVLNENNEKCQPGEMGELCFENKFFRGYINLPEMTEKAKRGGVYHTGDIGKYLPDGSIVLLGRNDDMEKINGNRVEPAEIEKTVKDVLKVKWAAAKVIKTESRVFVCAYYNEEPTVDLEEAKKKIAGKLPAYMVPAYYMRIETIPLNANGKFSRKDLPAPDLTNMQHKAYAAPETELQKQIIGAFEEVLKLEKIGIDDDFYEIGGDSISSIQVVALLQETDIEAADIFKGRTARKIAELVSETKLVNYNDEENEEALKKEQYLTIFQSHMLDCQFYSPKTTMLNLPIFVKIPEVKDPDKAVEALKRVLKAHPALFTKLRFNENQEIVQYYDFHEPVIKTIKVTEAEMIDIREELIQPFKMIESPLARFRRFETERHVYIFADMHHIIGDGTSLHVLTRDIAKALKGEELGKDYYYLALEEANKAYSTEQYLEDKEYYETLLNDTEWSVRPKEDFNERTNKKSSVEADLPIKEADYTRLMEKYGITENMLFIAVTVLSQAWYNDAKDVFITWTYNGRNSSVKDNIVGNMLCDLPIGIHIKEGMGLNEFMGEVKKQVNGGLSHLSYPYTLLEDDRVGQTDKTCFLYQKHIFDVAASVKNGVEMIELPNKYDSAENMFNVEIIDNGDGKTLVLEYEQTRYKEESIHKYRRYFQKIALRLVEFIDREDVAIDELMK